METETPSPRRRPSLWLLGLLGVAIVALVAYWMWPEPAPPPAAVPTARARPANRGGAGQSTDPTDLDVRLEALNGNRPVPGEVERNPFRFKPAPPPPSPPQPLTVKPPVPDVAPVLQSPPVTPIPLKFMGTVEGPGIKLAALTDCKGFTYSGREGETIDGRYKLVRIQTESVVMEYVNGTGRITIRKSGECGPVR